MLQTPHYRLHTINYTKDDILHKTTDFTLQNRLHITTIDYKLDYTLDYRLNNIDYKL